MSEWPKFFGNAAQITSALVAAVALGGIFYQVELAQKNAQLANARQVFLSYSSSTLTYPELTDPDYDKLKQDRTEFLRYKAFVGHMLFAYDEMLTISDEPEWVRTFHYDLPPHVKYLCEENDPKFFEQFYPKMRSLLAEAKKQCGK
jgi:hypothetical protein